jgi:hypothetical protein
MTRRRNERRSLRLESLDESRLVDLVAALLYPAADWIELARRDHRPDSDGCDIIGRESLGDLLSRTWVVRTVRAERATPDLIAAVTRGTLRAVSRVPDVLLVVTPVDVSESVRERFLHEATLLGVSNPVLWTKSDLQARLFEERPDLLFTYFGIPSFKRTRRAIRSIRRRIAIKNKLLKSFLRPVAERAETLVQPYDKLRFSKLLIRSIDDHSYPGADRELGHIRGWMEVGTYDFYHDGIEVILGTAFVLIDDAGAWAPVAVNQSFDATRYRRIRAFEIGRIPFMNIVTFDDVGDEYYAQPHVFCSFANAGLPFVDYRYYSVETPYRDKLDPSRMVGLAPAAVPERQLGIVGG